MVMFTWNSFSSCPSCVFVQLCVIWTFFLVWLFYFQDDSLGADAYWAAGLHLYTPLPFRPGRGGLGDRIKTHLFLNSGNLISLNTSMLWILLSMQKCMQCYVCNSIMVWPVSLGTWCILVHGFSSSHANLRLSIVIHVTWSWRVK